MADKFLNRDGTSGRVREIEATVVGGTNAQAGDIVALDATGRLDETLLPVGLQADVYSGTAGENLAAGGFVYVDGTGSVRNASAAIGGFDAMGFVLEAAASGSPATVYFEGRNTQLSGLTVGSRYYLAEAAGLATATPVSGAGARHQFLGKAITTNSLSFEPDDSITLA